MKRIDDRTVELTADEMTVSSEHAYLLDLGHSIPDAVSLIIGTGEAYEKNVEGARICGVPTVREELLAKLPNLDEVLTPEFVTYLSE